MRPVYPYFLLLLFLLLLSGCAGVRHSYESAIEVGSDPPTIVLKTGEKVEALAVGLGFPGYWGYFPAVDTCHPNIAAVVCRKQRSMIPFREPGVVFGGEVCWLEGRSQGETMMFFGSRYSPELSDNCKRSGRDGIRIQVVNPTGR